MQDSCAAEASRGARLLDWRLRKWAPRVDLKKLNISDGKRCVLGQLYGHFTKGTSRLQRARVLSREVETLIRQLLRYGFTVEVDASSERRSALNAAWAVEIHKRVA